MTAQVDPWTLPADGDELEQLRSGCPVSRGPSGAWFLARHDDVVAAAKDVETFVASFRAPGVVVPDEEQLISEIPEPRHGQIRRIINSAIAQHRIPRIEPFCRSLVDELLDDLLARDGEVDLVAELAMPVPNNVIAELLGAPRTDFRKWAAWSDEVVTGTWPVENRNERGEGLAGAHPEFTGYVDTLIADRRANPRDDFISRFVATEVDGRRLTDVEARTQLVFLFISGNETTRHLIANLLWRLAHDPELHDTLAADRSLVDNAIEECLRLDPPVWFLMRNCHRDVDMRGERIEAGLKVAFGLFSANRDPELFDDANTFRLDRPDPRSHLAFGGGPHVCPGASLARLEARVVLDVVLDRVARIRPVEPGTYENVPVMWAHGPSRLPALLTRR